MRSADMFSALVEYHFTRNVPQCMPHVVDGRVQSPKGLPYRQGAENKHYGGVLIISNGNTLLNRLKADDVLDDDGLEGFVEVPHKEELFQYLDGQLNNHGTSIEDEGAADGAYLYDGMNHRVTRVSQYNPVKKVRVNEQELMESLPADFISVDGSIPVEGKKVGTKTRLAVKIPRAYQGNHDVEGFMIKQSAYGQLGMGMVVHTTKDGVKETAHFRLGANGIECVHREYERKDGRVVLARESLMDVSQYTPQTYQVVSAV